MKPKYKFDIKLMSADCELNYARLCRMLPATTQPDAVADDCELKVDVAPGQPATLRFLIKERSPYTTTIDVQISLDGLDAAAAASTELLVRMYHDVRMAEVIFCSRNTRGLASFSYPNDAMFQPDEKAQQNRFLSEWLGLCLRDGMVSSSALETAVSEPAIERDSACAAVTDLRKQPS